MSPVVLDAGTKLIILSVNARKLVSFKSNTLISLFVSLCNSICSIRHWSPELHPEKLAILEAKALQDIQDLKNDACELKYLTYPETRPFGWEPPQKDFDDDVDEDDDRYHDDFFALHSRSQQLDEHLQMAETGGNPRIEALFGKTMAERLMLRGDLISQRKRGRPRKSEKSASGTLGPGNELTQQVNGSSLKRQANGPSKHALKGVQQRTGGLVNFGSLVQNNVLPGRILVRNF